MNATQEQWLPVVGFEGSYEVSNQGRVRSLARTVDRSGLPVRISGRVLKPWIQKGGYPAVTLRSDGRSFGRAVHTLVLHAFVGPRPDGMDACHQDGNPVNSSLSNLRWDTRSGNMQDALRHGTHNNASKTHCKRGHEFTPENTRYYTFRNGTVGRFCRACKRLSNRKALNPHEGDVSGH